MKNIYVTPITELVNASIETVILAGSGSDTTGGGGGNSGHGEGDNTETPIGGGGSGSGQVPGQTSSKPHAWSSWDED